MNWAMIIGGFLLGIMGFAMVKDGDNPFVSGLGHVIAAIAAVLSWYGWGMDATFHHPGLDKDKCAQYVQIDENWTCVPWEEAG